MSFEPSDKYTNSALRIGDTDTYPQRLVGEFIGNVVSNEWVNHEYKHVVLKVHEHALKAYAGQMFHLLCPSPDGAEVWMRRPMSVYRVDKAAGQVEFLYKPEGRGTRGMANSNRATTSTSPARWDIGFKLEPGWKNIVVLGRGVGFATLAPLSQLAAEHGVGVTAILSARNPDVVMSKELFEGLRRAYHHRGRFRQQQRGRERRENHRSLSPQGKADAFFTCGSNRLLKLMQRLGKKHNIPGQVAMEQIMVCGFGACYVCMRTFEVDGKRVLKRVCRDGPVFNMQEAVGW